MRIGFLGAGKMATAMAGGLLQKGVCTTDELVASDVLSRAQAAFSEATGCQTIDNNEQLVQQSDVVILAVKPQLTESVLDPLNGHFGHALVVSIAAGLPLRALIEWCQTNRVVRVMPNTPALVGMGASAFTCARGVHDDDREAIAKILGAIGIAYEVPEPAIDAVTGLSGSGPAYVFEFIQAMIDGGVDVGLSPDVATELTLQTLSGATEMVRQKLGTPEELRRAVTSPNGTTAAGLEVLHEGDLNGLMRRVIKRAKERSIELGA